MLLQQEVVKWLVGADSESYEASDCVPVPAYSNGQAARTSSHALYCGTAAPARGTSGSFYQGHKLLVLVLVHDNDSGAISGFVAAPANIQDHWLLDTLLAYRLSRWLCRRG